MFERMRNWWHSECVNEAVWWHKHWRVFDYVAMSFALFAIAYGIIDGSGISFFLGFMLLIVMYGEHRDTKIMIKLGFYKEFLARQQKVTVEEIDAKLEVGKLKKLKKYSLIHKLWDMMSVNAP